MIGEELIRLSINQSFTSILGAIMLNQWKLVNDNGEFYLPWQLLSKISNGIDITLTSLPNAPNDILIMLNWFMRYGAVGVIYKVQKLFPDGDVDNFFDFIKDYIAKEHIDKDGYYKVPKTVLSDIQHARRQENRKSITDYLNELAILYGRRRY